MKKYSLILAAAAALSLVACSKDNSKPDEQENPNPTQFAVTLVKADIAVDKDGFNMITMVASSVSLAMKAGSQSHFGTFRSGLVRRRHRSPASGPCMPIATPMIGETWPYRASASRKTPPTR